MSNRHLARTVVLQTLFQWDFNDCKEDLKKLLDRNFQEFAPDFDDGGFSNDLLMGVKKHFKEIDALIVKYAPEWPIKQITIVDRNVLRIGIYELKFSQEIPPKVAINEAIELAKSFSSESSGKFVNGVLGSIYKEMEEKGEKKEMVINPEPKEICAGGVIYCKTDNGLKFVTILDAYGKWTFPKGHVEAEEKIEDTAKREIGEEVGLKEIKLISKIGETDYEVHQPQMPPFIKRVHFFLFESPDQPLVVEQAEEIRDAKWATKEEVLNILDYQNAREIFEAGLRKLL
jgi:transcription antitermination protein NusB